MLRIPFFNNFPCSGIFVSPAKRQYSIPEDGKRQGIPTPNIAQIPSAVKYLSKGNAPVPNSFTLKYRDVYWGWYDFTEAWEKG